MIELDGELFRIVDFQHVKPGKGGAFVRTKLKNVEKGAVIDKTFRAGEKMQEAVLERRPMQYLYRDGELYVFMDRKTYEQLSMGRDLVEESSDYLVENQDVGVLLKDGKPLVLELPNTVKIKVIKADPGLKGDRVGGAMKPVTLETGKVIQVPLFIEKGDTLKIDTRTGDYISRI